MTVTLPAGRPPTDGSGGFMVVRYSVAGRPVTFSRIHVSPFNRITKAYVGGPGDEADIHETFANLVEEGTGQGHLAKFFSTDTRIELVSIWQRQGDGSVIKVSPLISSSDGSYYYSLGTNSGAPTLVEGYSQNILNFETTRHNRARLRLVAAVDFPIAQDKWVFSDGGGTVMQKLVNYLTASTSQVVARDGTKYVDPAHVTSTIVKRLRAEAQRT